MPVQIRGLAASSSRIVSKSFRLPMSHRKPCQSTSRMAPKATTIARMCEATASTRGGPSAVMYSPVTTASVQAASGTHAQDGNQAPG